MASRWDGLSTHLIAMATVEPLREGPLSENVAGETTRELGSTVGGTSCLRNALYSLPQLERVVEEGGDLRSQDRYSYRRPYSLNLLFCTKELFQQFLLD